LRSLYVSIPFAVSLREGRAAGLFWDNPAKQVWDIGVTAPEEWRMNAAGGEIDLYLFPGPEASRVVERFTELTGRMPLLPRWALGYHQSRYSYASRAELERIAREFRRRKIPCDALYLDIDHMDGFRVFTFGRSIPRPRSMLARLHRQGFKVVAIVDPGVKNDPRFGLLRRGRKLDAFVKAPGGRRDFIAKLWPGKCRFPDFFDPTARRWWGREQARFQRLGLDGFWNDMNEPATFDGPGKTLALKCVHTERETLAPRPRGKARRVGDVHHVHAAVHNAYGMLMARASRDGALAGRPAVRPFIVSRAGYAGIQRFAVVWTGDNSSTWEHLAGSVPMLLNLGLSGVPFCGADVGGFLDNATGELLVRWTQLAAFTPFFRNHCNKDARPQEPWVFGPEVERICRKFIQHRYRLVPYLSQLVTEAHERGTPIIRPLFYHYQDDPVAAGVGDQFLLGRDLLVAPVLQQGAVARCVYLPRGTWLSFWNRRQRHGGGRHVVAEAPLDAIPVFVRAGASIPTGPVRQFIAD
jgi:alpha-glucosidase